MLRLGSRGCVIALLGSFALLACKGDAGTSTLGSPNASAAGHEAHDPGSRVAGTSKAGSADALARSLVAVAATIPGDAVPCERTCGRVGDCLLEEDGNVGEFEAARLELECLDVCVHSPQSDGPQSDGPRSAFLACEQQTGCGPLLGCARSNWDALVATRSGPSGQGVTTGGNSCADSCEWWLACAINGMPPDQAPLPSHYEENVRGCEMQCEAAPAEREMFTRLGDCARANCSPERLSACYEHL
jgi:hypothetical protein